MDNITAELIAGLKSSDSEIRIISAKRLGASCESPGPVIEALLEALPDQNAFVNTAIERALIAIGDTAVSELVGHAVAKPRVGIHLEHVIFRFGPSDLTRLITKETIPQRKARLVSCAPRDPAILPVLIELLECPEEEVLSASANCLAHFGYSASSAVPRLATILSKTQNENTILTVIQTIGKIGRQDMVSQQILIPMVNSTNKAARITALIALKDLNFRSEEFWLKLLNDPDRTIKACLLEAFESFKDLSPAAFTTLMTYMAKAPDDDKKTGLKLFFKHRALWDNVADWILTVIRDNSHDKTLRLMAINAVAEKTYEQTTIALKEILADSDDDIAKASLKTLLNHKRLTKADITSVIEHPDQAVRRRMFQMWNKELRSSDLYSFFIGIATNSSDPEIRKHAELLREVTQTTPPPPNHLVSRRILKDLITNRGMITNSDFKIIETRKNYFTPKVIKLLSENLDLDVRERIALLLADIHPELKMTVSQAKLSFAKKVSALEKLNKQTLIEKIIHRLS